jgi:hypothetical protein
MQSLWYVPFNLLNFNCYEELLEERQFECKSDGCLHEETWLLLKPSLWLIKIPTVFSLSK